VLFTLQFVLILQSYSVLAVNPEMVTEVELTAVTALVHVVEEAGL
jgi:ABC-type tungstate transport system permease subunit